MRTLFDRTVCARTRVFIHITHIILMWYMIGNKSVINFVRTHKINSNNNHDHNDDEKKMVYRNESVSKNKLLKL